MGITATLQNDWLVACTSRQLTGRPMARTVLGKPLAIFRSQDSLGALLDRCPHRNAPLSAGKVIENLLQCPYHGWRFDNAGACRRRPGMAETCSGTQGCGTQAFHIREQDGLVWVCLGEPETDQPAPNRWSRDPEFESFIWDDTVKADLADALENLLDGTHTPFVHAGIVRNADRPQTFRASIRLEDDFVEAEYSGEGKQSGWISQIFERDRASSYGRYLPPCTAELEYTSGRGTEFVLDSHFTPESDGQLRVYSTINVRRSLAPLWLKRILLTPFFRRVVKQDRDILRLQQENIARFGGRDYEYWEADLLRGWIDSWLRHRRFPQDGPQQQAIELRM